MLIPFRTIDIIPIDHPMSSDSEGRDGSANSFVGGGVEVNTVILRPVGNGDDFLGGKFGDAAI